MARERHLGKAPITEALVDLCVKLRPGFEVSEFSRLKKALHSRYPEVQEKRLLESTSEMKTGKAVSKRDELQGFFFKSNDGLNVAQFRIDGFTFSRLKPYTCWKDLLSEAQDLWGHYRNAAKPESVTRIAVRYINHLELPLPIRSISDYITAPPGIPLGLKSTVSSFLSRVVIQEPENDLSANITQVSEGTSDGKAVRIILDIDAYKTGQFSLGEGEKEMWSMFEALRHFKNKIFFSSITDETAGLFE